MPLIKRRSNQEKRQIIEQYDEKINEFLDKNGEENLGKYKEEIAKELANVLPRAIHNWRIQLAKEVYINDNDK